MNDRLRIWQQEVQMVTFEKADIIEMISNILKMDEVLVVVVLWFASISGRFLNAFKTDLKRPLTMYFNRDRSKRYKSQRRNVKNTFNVPRPYYNLHQI